MLSLWPCHLIKTNQSNLCKRVGNEGRERRAIAIAQILEWTSIVKFETRLRQQASEAKEAFALFC